MPAPERTTARPTFAGEAQVSRQGTLRRVNLGGATEQQDPFAALVTHPEGLQAQRTTGEQPDATVDQAAQGNGFGTTLIELIGKVAKHRGVRTGSALLFVSATTMGANAECGDGGLQERQQQRRIADLNDGPPDGNEDAAENDRRRREDNRQRREDRQRRRAERTNN